MKHLEKQGAEVIGTAPYELGKQFAETLAKYQQFQDVRNLGAAVASMVEATNERWRSQVMTLPENGRT